ncbi:MAG: threonine synthase [Armatimonadota bacterium]
MYIFEKYKEYLPITSSTPLISLEECNTPLIPSKFFKDHKVYYKFEGMNPTGSFKDRGMCITVSKALEEGAKAVICASTGNTSASAAAYAARAGIKCIVLIPHNSIALGKLSQAMIVGAKVIAVKANFDKALELVRSISKNYPVTLVNSVNPYRISGQKTASFEICDKLGSAPDYLFIPVGNAGNITAYWKGFKEYKDSGKIDSLPKMMGFQAEGASPIVNGKVVENPQTLATAIKIGNPASWKGAVDARDSSGGLIESVTDNEIIKAHHILAVEEGIFTEPASAASVAGLIKLIESGYFKEKNRNIVCVLTGHGLKDPDFAVKHSPQVEVTEPDEDKILEKAGLL